MTISWPIAAMVLIVDRCVHNENNLCLYCKYLIDIRHSFMCVCVCVAIVTVAFVIIIRIRNMDLTHTFLHGIFDELVKCLKKEEENNTT